MPIETGPGEEFQFDWSDCNYFARRWGWDHELHCFGTRVVLEPDQVLVVRGRRSTSPTPWRAWCSSSRPSAASPRLGRTDRMGQLGQSRGKAFVLHPVALSFARHYDFALKACDAGTPSARARSSDRFATSSAGSSPRSTSTRPRTSASSTAAPRRGWRATCTPWCTGRPRWHQTSASPSSAAARPRCPGALRHRRARHRARWDASPWSSGTRCSTRPRPSSPARSSRSANRSAMACSSCASWAASWPSTAWRRPARNPSGCPSTEAAAEAIALGRRRHLRPSTRPTPPHRAGRVDLGAGDYDVAFPTSGHGRIGRTRADSPVDIAAHGTVAAAAALGRS